MKCYNNALIFLIIQNGMKWVLRATYLPLPYTFIDNIQ